MPSVRATSSALRRSREAIAVTSLHSPFCIPGMTFLTPIAAVLRTPQRTLLAISGHHRRKCVLDKSRRLKRRVAKDAQKTKRPLNSHQPAWLDENQFGGV